MDQIYRYPHKLFTFSVLFILAICMRSSLLVAQTTTANIEGVVKDSKGIPASDVEVVARNQESGYYQITYTSEAGTYRLAGLMPGMYQVRAAHLDFTPMTQKDIRLMVGQTVKINFSLTGKTLQEQEVVVEATPPLIDTKKSDLSALVMPEQITNLPLNSRNFLELAEVAPGAKASTGGRGPVTTGAVNSRFISAFIDGGEFKSDNLGGVLGTSFGITTNIVPEDAIREFEVITSLYKAEYSGASNGIINAVTKTGGNELHGSAFSYFRTTSLNAQGAFESAKPDFNRQQFGFSLGGPIVEDQTHFFVSMERDNINNFTSVVTGGVQPSLNGTFKTPIQENLLLANLTHQFNSTNSLEIRWIRVGTDNKPGNFGALSNGNISTVTNGINLNFTLNSLLATERWQINDKTLNEFRVHYQRYLKNSDPNSSQPEYFYQSSRILTGWNDTQPQTEDLGRFQIRDDISYAARDMMGSHVFKGGLNFEREPISSTAAFFSGAEFLFHTDTDPLPYQAVIGMGNSSTSLVDYKYGIYAQDDWTVLPYLTLNLGLRWDVESNMIDQNYRNPFAGDTALTNHVPSNYIATGNRSIDYGNVAPRIGLAWDVMKNNSTVAHAGYGIFYDRLIYNIVQNEQQNGIYNTYTIPFTAAPATLNVDTLKSYVRRNIGNASAPALVLLPSSVPTPYTQQWTVGLTQQITEDIAASVDFVQIRGYNEYTTYNVNYQNGVGGPRVMTKQFAGIALLSSAGKSWYDAYQFSLTRPYRNDWQMQFSYTLAWADNTFDDPFQGYVFQSSIARAPSLQDERHRFVLSGIVNLPLDFQISGITTLASPHPIPVTTGVDNNHDGVLADDFPNGVRNSIRPDIAKMKYWYRDVDLRITKFFELSKNTKIGLIAEAFNLFNWSNYTSYFSVLNRSNFGRPNAAYAGRQVQLGMRLYY